MRYTEQESHSQSILEEEFLNRLFCLLLHLAMRNSRTRSVLHTELLSLGQLSRPQGFL